MNRSPPSPPEMLRTGRLVGALFLAHAAIAPVLNFVVLKPIVAAPGFLAHAAPHATAVGLAIVMTLAAGLIALATQLVAWRAIERVSRTLALALVALATALFASAVAEAAALGSMLALSQAWVAGSGGPELASTFEPARALAAAGRSGAHYSGLVLGGLTLLVFHATAFRHRLVPRAISGFGTVAAALQIGAVAAPWFGAPVNFALLAPIGLAQLVLVAWLLARGFAAPRDDAAAPSRPD